MDEHPKPLSKAALARIKDVLSDPYEGVIYGQVGSRQGRDGRYSTLRTEDLQQLVKLAGLNL